MNKKKVILYENKVKMPKLVNFVDKYESDSEKRNLQSKRSKRSKMVDDKINNKNNLSSNHKYYKSFYKKNKKTKRNNIKRNQISDENKNNISKKTPPLIKINSSSFLLNDNGNINDKSVNLNEALIQKTFSNVIKIKVEKDKEKNIINPLKFSFNDNEQIQDNKTRRTEYKTSDKKKNNLLHISLSDYFNKSASLLSTHTHNDRTPNTLNNISVKKKQLKKQTSSILLKNFNQKNIMNKSYKINDKRDDNLNDSKIIYKKGNFLHVKKMDLKGKNKKDEEEISFDNNFKKDSIDNNKTENNFIGPKKKKYLFCCIPLN